VGVRVGVRARARVRVRARVGVRVRVIGRALSPSHWRLGLTRHALTLTLALP
jgi:hypothetical protein